MGRVTLVTGGTCGIGEATCTTLKLQGYTVVANYGSNDQAADAFTERAAIPAIKFDAADFETVFGPAEILVNNAGVTVVASLR